MFATTSNSFVSAVASATEPRLEWAVLTRARHGEAVCGDLGLVRVMTHGALVAAIDGLGHGLAAAEAAGLAGAVVAESEDCDVAAVMHRCHRALEGTRGAAISLAWLSFADRAITWLALGDVDGRVLSVRLGRGREHALRLPGGVAGHNEPMLAPATVEVRRGDVIVLASDGVDGAFADTLTLAGPARDIAERILATSWDGADDGLVVVLRWLSKDAPEAQ